ncbi:MAG: 2OG-Fe(II) oxygenase [Lewinellaceae bacterium]|nr:2OG-Fe(II) oxygenase [Lewinellaceae bacterium]
MESQFEALIDGVLARHYGTVKHFVPPALVAALREHLLATFRSGAMKPAGTGRLSTYDQNLAVRGDVIHWLEKDHNAAEKMFLEHIEQFIAYLNRTCYTGINAYEFHYALYPTGHFYKRHRDQLQSDAGRKFSFVLYLNEDWLPENEGCLVLYPEGQPPVRVLPEGGHSVFFRADELEHEVAPANRPRLSIAGWLKQV